MKPKRTTQRVVLERLEDRLLLDGNVTAEIVGLTLLIEGDHRDNAIILDQTADGGFRITGADHRGPTLVNGEAGVSLGEAGDVRNVQIRMHFGNDRVCVGNRNGLSTLIDGDLLVNMGAGQNEFYLGRHADASDLWYAGPVVVGGNVDIGHQDNGAGSVTLAALRCGGDVNVDLGHGYADKHFIMEDNIPSYLPHLLGTWRGAPYGGTGVDGSVTVTNPSGPTHVRVGQSTIEGRLTLRTAREPDVIDILSTRVNRALVIETGPGFDSVCVGYPFLFGVPRDPTFAYALTIDTGDNDDQVFLANLDVWTTTRVDLGAADTWQQLRTADMAFFQTQDFTISAAGTTRVRFGRMDGPTETTQVIGELRMTLSDNSDMVDARGLKVWAGAAIMTGAGHDVLNIALSEFRGDVEFLLGDGDDMMYLGNVTASQSGRAGGLVRFRDSLEILAGAGAETVSLQGVVVEGNTFVEMAGTAGRAQTVQLGSDRGLFCTTDLTVGGSGRTTVMIGGGRTYSAWIYGGLQIALGASPGNDWVLVQNTVIGGNVKIETGGGWDIVYMQRAVVLGDTVVDTGAGSDAVMGLDCFFGGATDIRTGDADDGMFFGGCVFDGRATFDGGGSAGDFINHGLETTNTFNSGLTVTGIPVRRY